MSLLLGSTLPAGTIIQSPFELADPNWARCDGSIISRSVYAALAALFPGVGTFTATLRTLAAASSASYASAANNGTNVVAIGASGTSAIQLSTNNGVSWTTETTPSSFAPIQVIATGNNFFAIGSSAVPGIISPSSSGTGTWTASTGLSGSPTSCATNGTGTIVVSTASACYVSTNYGSTFSASTGGPANSTVVWTGTRFVGISNAAGGTYSYSTTGAASSWTTPGFAPWGVVAPSGAASDGAGNILVILPGWPTAWASADNGTTWRQVMLPNTTQGTVSYTNGRWFVPLQSFTFSSYYIDGSFAVSTDANSWTWVPNIGVLITTSATNSPSSVSYIGGNYVIVTAGQTSATTVTENTGNMYLPISRRSLTLQSGSGSPTPQSMVSVANYQEWIKLS